MTKPAIAAAAVNRTGRCKNVLEANFLAGSIVVVESVSGRGQAGQGSGTASWKNRVSRLSASSVPGAAKRSSTGRRVGYIMATAPLPPPSSVPPTAAWPGSAAYAPQWRSCEE